MRLMSFALTTAQIMEETKDVTRRLGWRHLRAGHLVCPVKKCMGLRPGEKVQVLRDPLLIVSTRREPLRRMTDDLEYGYAEVAREGFKDHPDYGDPGAWVAMFCATHRGCTPDTVITRIEFTFNPEGD